MTNKSDIREFYLRVEHFDRLCASRGWDKLGPNRDGRGKYSAFAKALCCKKQTAHSIAKGTYPLKGNLQIKVIELIQGDVHQNYSILFDIRASHLNVGPNHPAYNNAKYEGSRLYEPYSTAAIFRGEETRKE
jgi:hypothetical protein